MLRRNSDHDSSDRENLIPLTVNEKRPNHFLHCILKRMNLRTIGIILFFFGCLYGLAIFTSAWFLSISDLNNSRNGKVSFSSFLDEYDLGCNGYPMDHRIATQMRILSSVRSELIDSSRKLEEVIVKYEELTKEIGTKQSELDSVKSEIENAIRVLKDWNDRRNVRVSLPHKPLFPMPMESAKMYVGAFTSLEKAIDFSRCSISTFLRIYIYPLTIQNPLADMFDVYLRNSRWNIDDPKKACLFVNIVENSVDTKNLQYWNSNGRNHLIINIGNDFIQPLGASILLQNMWNDINLRKGLDFPAFLNTPQKFDWRSVPPVLPYQKENFIFYLVEESSYGDMSNVIKDIRILRESAANSGDAVVAINCAQDDSDYCIDENKRVSAVRSAIFTIIRPSTSFYSTFYNTLNCGSIPVVLSTGVKLPFEECIDWNLAAIQLPESRFPELHFFLRSISMADILEMRRMGRLYMEHYIGTVEGLSSTLLSCMSSLMKMLSHPAEIESAQPLFPNNSFVAPILTPVNLQLYDDEYLGPLEAPYTSPSFLHNFTSIQMYSRHLWSVGLGNAMAPEYLPFSVDPPAETEFYPDANIGFRPIEPGSGKEFSQSLGGNRAREQFTVVILTYNRDAVLSASLERLHKMPYLNKVIIIWNNIGREPVGAWPRLHVHVEFIKVTENSLNNRFIPWDRIETEAVLSLDDDIDLKQHEIIFAFRVWRDNRDRIVGFPARYHARYGDSMFYNSNHTCQLSIVLTGAAFIHKAYFHAYNTYMPAVIRKHVDEITNCEDIAMNFLVSHLTRKPPIKTTSKWTLRCPTCSETLSQDESHFSERHECIRFFTKVYGYNPLKFSQFRADSVLFKTRVPASSQKCFKYV